MRSVYTKILLWSLATLLVSMGLFFVISRRIAVALGTGDIFRNIVTFEREEARASFESGGQQSVSAFLARLSHVMGWQYYFLSDSGADLAAGADRSDLLWTIDRRWNQPIQTEHGTAFATPTSDRKYILLAVSPANFSPWLFLPYYGIILVTVGVLCWPLALHIGSPLRTLAGTVGRFGKGDFSVRSDCVRRDEIGNLAREFNQMADRIETLLTAERRLLQDVSHELRSPLARLSFAAELIQAEPDTSKSVTRIRKEVSRLSALVGTLLEMARAEGDPASRRTTEFFLDDLVGGLVEDCAAEARARSCGIDLNCAERIALCGDEELFRRAVENVLRNAIRYAPEHTSVDVKVAARNGLARIEVRDEGPGIAEEHLSQIFHPFFRVDEARDPASGGIGLGLSIAMRAIRLHNGTIEARNATPGLRVVIEVPGLASA
ncbi:MAG: HAMP domain-containing protein [Acidobacteriota bacterium]|nr:HAMP domain-containing protein [Acidobacteriota bacterium]